MGNLNNCLSTGSQPGSGSEEGHDNKGGADNSLGVPLHNQGGGGGDNNGGLRPLDTRYTKAPTGGPVAPPTNGPHHDGLPQRGGMAGIGPGECTASLFFVSLNKCVCGAYQ